MPNIGGLMLGVDPAGLSQIIDAPESSPLPDGFLLSSMRNQLTIAVRSNRLDFDDGSGEMPVRADFPDRVAQTARYIAAQTAQTYAAVGLVFEIEAEPEDEELPSKAVLARFVREDVLGGSGYDAIGASARLWYVARDRLHDLRIEPRGNQYEGRNYFASLSIYLDPGSEVPSTEWLSHALDEEYGDLVRVLAEVLEKRGGH